MTNQANKWAPKGRQTVLKSRSKHGKCEARGCTKKIKFMAHIRVTPLDDKNNMGNPRGRKERISDYRKYPKHYRGLCATHYKTDKQAKHHDHIQLLKSKKRRR